MEIDEGKEKSSIVGENWSQGHSLASAISATTTELWQLSYDTPVVIVFYTYYMWLISEGPIRGILFTTAFHRGSLVLQDTNTYLTQPNLS